MKYNPQKTGEHIGSPQRLPRRKSIRLKGYDYSQAGLYFITICCQNRAHLFGHIENGEMILNDAGKMVGKWYFELENKFPDIRCHEMITMPNHFHCIIEIVGVVGADLRVCPNTANVEKIPGDPPKTGEHIGSPLQTGEHTGSPLQTGEHIGSPLQTGEHIGSPLQTGEHTGSPVYRVVQWFKTMSTNEYIRGVKNLGWPAFNGKLWQRNYWEHIIRNHNEFQSIAAYIIDNPQKWEEDKLRM